MAKKSIQPVTLKDSKAVRLAQRICKAFGVTFTLDAEDDIYLLRCKSAKSEASYEAWDGNEALLDAIECSFILACDAAGVPQEIACEVVDKCQLDVVLEVALAGDVATIAQTVDLFLEGSDRVIRPEGCVQELAFPRWRWKEINHLLNCKLQPAGGEKEEVENE